MTNLYNCKHDGDQYRVTKFDDQMNIESSYLVDATSCECPAFDKRGRCKHQEMLPYFINRKAVGSGEMYDWIRGGWVRMFEDPEPDTGPSTEDQTAFVEAVLAAEGRQIPATGRQISIDISTEPAPMAEALLAQPEFVQQPAKRFRRR